MPSLGDLFTSVRGFHYELPARLFGLAATSTSLPTGTSAAPILLPTSTCATPMLLTIPAFPTEGTKKSTSLTDLIESERIYVEYLTGIIQKVPAAWSRSNSSPPELNDMFRSVESVYKANRTFLAKLNEIESSPSSPKVLEDLLMRWIHDLKWAYSRYCLNFTTGFDQWKPVKSNAKLPRVLEAFSAYNPPSIAAIQSSQLADPSLWTLDALFLLPKCRLLYYRKLYDSVLRGTILGTSEHRLLTIAREELDSLLETLAARNYLRVGHTLSSSPSSSLLPPVTSGEANESITSPATSKLTESNGAGDPLLSDQFGEGNSSAKTPVRENGSSGRELTAREQELQGSETRYLGFKPDILLKSEEYNKTMQPLAQSRLNTFISAYSEITATEEQTSQESTGSESDSLQDLTHLLQGRSHYPITSGGFGDIWKCDLVKLNDTVQVAVKTIRAFDSDNDVLMRKNARRVRRELKVWGRLKHECILPLWGVANSFGSYPAMICPWVDNGALTGFLERQQDTLSFQDKFSLLNDIALGLQYLHSKSIVHGDLTGSNVLVHGDGRACLADFGLSTILLEFIGPSYLTSSIRGNVRWAAAELFDVPEDGENEAAVCLSTECDIYSFGSIALQVLTCKVPYYNVKRDIVVLGQVMKGKKPEPPEESPIVELHWKFIQRCWLPRASRPPVGKIVEFVACERQVLVS